MNEIGEDKSLEEKIKHLIVKIRTSRENRLDGLKDLYRAHLDCVINGKQNELLELMIDNGLIDVLSIVFSEETAPEILTVGCFLSCVISENIRLLRATPEEKTTRFVQHLLNMFTTGDSRLRLNILRSVAQMVKDMPSVGEKLAQSEIVGQAASLLHAPPPTVMPFSTSTSSSASTSLALTLEEKQGLLQLLSILVRSKIQLGDEEAILSATLNLEKEASERGDDESLTDDEREKWEDVAKEAVSLVKLLRKKRGEKTLSYASMLETEEERDRAKQDYDRELSSQQQRISELQRENENLRAQGRTPERESGLQPQLNQPPPFPQIPTFPGILSFPQQLSLQMAEDSSATVKPEEIEQQPPLPPPFQDNSSQPELMQRMEQPPRGLNQSFAEPYDTPYPTEALVPADTEGVFDSPYLSNNSSTIQNLTEENTQPSVFPLNSGPLNPTQ